MADSKNQAEVLKRGYSDNEVVSIYELGRFFLENGDIRSAEVIIKGLVEVSPDFLPAWLALAYIHVQNHAIEDALQAARQAVKLDGSSAEAQLFAAACLMATGDFNSGGTYLGEVGERIEAGAITNPAMVRFYRLQLARFQNRV